MVDLETAANNFLEYMVANSSPIWQTAIAQAYGGTDAGAQAIGRCEKKLKALGATSSKVRGFADSPSLSIVDWNNKHSVDTRLLPSQCKAVIALLKADGRIVQVGSGHGKATLIIRPYEFVKAKTIKQNDVVGLIEALTDGVVGSMQDVELLRTTCAEQSKEIDTLRAKVLDLQHENALSTSSTWS